MKSWVLQFMPRAEREFGKLPETVRQQIGKALDRLAFELNNPREPKVSATKKLSGRGNEWRLRVGDYRVVFERQGDHLIILVLHVGNRRDVYQG